MPAPQATGAGSPAARAPPSARRRAPAVPAGMRDRDPQVRLEVAGKAARDASTGRPEPGERGVQIGGLRERQDGSRLVTGIARFSVVDAALHESGACAPFDRAFAGSLVEAELVAGDLTGFVQPDEEIEFGRREPATHASRIGLANVLHLTQQCGLPVARTLSGPRIAGIVAT